MKDEVVNNEVLPPGEKRKRTETNYAKMFEDYDEESDEDTDDNASKASEYNDEANQSHEEDDNLGSLFERVHISSPTPQIIATSNISTKVHMNMPNTQVTERPFSFGPNVANNASIEQPTTHQPGISSIDNGY